MKLSTILIPVIVAAMLGLFGYISYGGAALAWFVFSWLGTVPAVLVYVVVFSKKKLSMDRQHEGNQQ